MKINHLIVICLTLALYSCTKELEQLHITGSVQGFTTHTEVSLLDSETRKVLDSTVICDGAFTLRAQLDQAPKKLRIEFIGSEIKDNRDAQIFVANEAVTLTATKDDFQNSFTVQGSKHHDIKATFDALVSPLEEKRFSELQKMIAIRNAGNWNDSLQDAYWGKNGKMTLFDNQYEAIQRDFIATHINSYYGLDLLSSSRKYQSPAFIQTQLASLTTTFKDTEEAKMLALFLETTPLKVNDAFYDFNAENIHGEQMALSDLMESQDKYTLLEFYSPYCGWCIAAVPDIKKLEQTQADKLEVISINVHRDKQKWLDDHQSLHPERKSLLLDKGDQSKPYLKYDIAGTPTYYLLNPTGKIVKKWTGFDEYFSASLIKTLNEDQPLTLVNGR